MSVIQGIIRRRFVYQADETIRSFVRLSSSSSQNLARAIDVSSGSFQADLGELNNRGSFENFLSWARNRNRSQIFIGSTVMFGFGVFSRHLFNNPDIATRFLSFISSIIWRSESGRITSTVSPNVPGNMLELIPAVPVVSTVVSYIEIYFRRLFNDPSYFDRSLLEMLRILSEQF